MRLCIVGIGGCGGALATEFLQNQDVTVMGCSLGEHICLGGLKGLWLEADVDETKDQAFFGSLLQGRYPGYLIPHDVISSDSRTSRYISDEYGYDLKKQGFFRQAEFLKAVFDIFESDLKLREIALSEYGSENPILTEAWKIIRDYTTLTTNGDNNEGSTELCDGILFMVSLGGGTGTGFINPITGYIKDERRSYPVFVLGVLTEEGKDKQQQADEARRALAASISIYDLLTKSRGDGVDGLILVDNQFMMERFGGDYLAIDRHIYSAMEPMLAPRSYPREDPTSLPIREKFFEILEKPPILVPCYYGCKRKNGQEGELVRRALKGGRLFPCEPERADRAFVFARGYLDSEELARTVEAETGISKVSVWRKLGENRRNEVLVLLRNPYGVSGMQEVRGTLEQRLYRLIGLALSYLETHRSEVIRTGMPDVTKMAIKEYFFGPAGLRSKFAEAMGRIERGEESIFAEELRIFGEADVTGSVASEAVAGEEDIKAVVERVLREKSLI